MKIFSILPILLLSLAPVSNAQAQPPAKKIDGFMKAYYDAELFMGTVLVAEKGKVLYKNGFGFANLEWQIPSRPEDVFNIASITKTFTGTLAMLLVQEGKLKLADNISDFLPYYRKDTGARVTIHHLLTHSSGIPNFLEIPGFMKDKAREPMGNLDDFIVKYCSLDLEFAPGSAFKYNNSGYVILGAIIEKASGMPFASALREMILRPCGMARSGLDYNQLPIAKKMTGYTRKLDGSFEIAPYWDRTWAFAAGQMYSSVGDLLKFHRALMGEKLLKREYKEMMFTPYFPAFKTMHYGYGWTIREVPDRAGRMLKVTSHEGGIFGVNTYFQRLPEKDQVVVLLNNTQDTPGKEISNGLFAILNGTPYALPKKSIARQVYRELNRSGAAIALQRYDRLKKQRAREFNFDEGELNRLGYDLLGAKRLDEAIAVFKKNVESFPDSGNAHDSLGEGYLARGDRAEAIACYRKALALDPKNENARKIIADLERSTTN
jgi:CubicO group peptidase (beta-lactamase class C family)